VKETNDMVSQAPEDRPLDTAVAQVVALDYESSEPSFQDKRNTRHLTDKAVGGAGWLTLSAMATKVIALLGFVLLGGLLTNVEFGTFAAVMMIQTLFAVVQVFGLRDILTQQHDRIRENVNPAFWLSMTLGVGTMLGMIAVAVPVSNLLASREYDPYELRWLIILFSARCVIEAAQNVSQSMLQLQLRFREVAIMNAVISLVQTAIVVTLAVLGAGASSMLISILASGTLAAIISWRLTKPAIQWRLQIEEWPRFFRAGLYLAGTAFVSTIIANGDYMALSLLATAAVVGVYFFAFNQAIQSNVLFVGSVTAVLFATLSKMGESAAEQKRIALSSLAPLSMVSVPINFIQASAAFPLFLLIFPKQLESTVPFIVLSISMAMSMIGAPSAALMRAQGRFAFFFVWNAVQAAIFMTVIFIAAYVGRRFGHPAETVSAMVLIHYTIFGVLGMRLACGRMNGFWPVIFKATLVPMAMALLGAFVAHSTLYLMPEPLRQSNLYSLGHICVINLGVYLLGVRLVMVRDWNEICERGLAMYRKRRIRPLVSYPDGV